MVVSGCGGVFGAVMFARRLGLLSSSDVGRRMVSTGRVGLADGRGSFVSDTWSTGAACSNMIADEARPPPLASWPITCSVEASNNGLASSIGSSSTSLGGTSSVRGHERANGQPAQILKAASPISAQSLTGGAADFSSGLLMVSDSMVMSRKRFRLRYAYRARRVP